MSGKYWVLDHTADARIRAEGADFCDTLRALCLGMWSLIADPGEVPDLRAWEVSAEGHDLEQLVVGLLNEHLYRLSLEGLVVRDLVVERTGPFRVVTRCRGAALSDGVQASCEVKAATYHAILVTPTLMEVTFDL